MRARTLLTATAMLVAALAESPAALSVASQGAALTPAGASQIPLLRPLPDLEGRPRNLAEHRGRVLVLNFWATWCVPCVEELPMLEGLGRLYAERGVDVVAVSADGPGREADVRRFVAANNVGLEVRTGALTPDMQALGLGEALPATALFDRDGAVAFRLTGPLRREELTERVEWLLGDRATPAPAPVVEAAPHAEAHHHDEHHHHGAAGEEGGSLVPS